VIGFLHTATAHVAPFAELLAREDAGIAGRHAVREDLLASARRDGTEAPALAREVAEVVHGLVSVGARIVLCTCSTIGALVERTEVAAGAVALRVDRPIAARAVEMGPRIAVVAALASTLAPTRALLHEEAARVGRALDIRDVLCEEAWPHFERGETAAYLDAVVAATQRALPAAGVVVLAQASMAPAAERFAGSPVPVLSSPRLGVAAAVRAHRARSRGPA
jgi:hypothetical protein